MVRRGRLPRLLRAARAVTAALLLLAPATALTATPPATPPTTPWTPTEDDAWFLALKVGQRTLGDGLRGHATPEGLCLDLGDVVRATAIPLRIDKVAERASGWVFEEGQTLTIDRAAGTVTRAGATSALAPAAIRDTPEGWCVDTTALGEWLDVTLTPDLANATLGLAAANPLPFERAAERRAAAAKLGARAAGPPDLSAYPRVPLPYRAWRPPVVDVDVGLTAARGPGGATRIAPRYAIAAAGEVLGASVTARLTSGASLVPADLRVTAYRSDPDGRLLGPLRATQVMAGDVVHPPSAAALPGAAGRGLYLTNQPLAQAAGFGTTELRGALERGWDVELYHDGQLIAIRTDDGSGGYAFTDIALRAGANRLELVFHGPQGQVRRERLSRPVGPGALAPGRTSWWAGVMQAGEPLWRFATPPPGVLSERRQGLAGVAGWRGSVGLSHAVSRTTLISGALHGYQAQAGPAGADGARARIWRWAGDATVQQALPVGVLEAGVGYRSDGAGAVSLAWLGRLGNGNLRASAIRTRGDFANGLIGAGDTGLYQLWLDQGFRLGRQRVPVALAARLRTRADGGERLEAGLRSGLSFDGLSLTATLDYRRERTSGGPDALVREAWAAGLMANARVGAVRLRGEARWDAWERDAGAGPASGVANAASPSRRGGLMPSSLTLTADGALDDATAWRAQIARGGDGWRLGGGLTREWRALRVTGEGFVDTRGAMGLSLSAAFSFGPAGGGGGAGGGGAGRWALAARPRTQGGEVAVDVYLDANGNGRREAGEAGLPDVAVTAGGLAAEAATDAAGRARILGVAVHQPVLVTIDPASIADPQLRPGAVTHALVARPGVAARVALGVVPTGSVEGTLTTADGRPVAGAGVELVGADGRVVVAAASEYDGFVLLEGVPYGRWTLRLTQGSAKALGVGGDTGAVLAREVEVSGARPRRVIDPLTLPAP